MLATTSVHIGPENADRLPGTSGGRIGYEEGCPDANTSKPIISPSKKRLEQAIDVLLSSVERHLLAGPSEAEDVILTAAMTYAEAIRDASQTARRLAEAQEKPPTVMLGYDVKYEALREEKPLDPEGSIEYNVDVEEEDPI